MVLRLENSAGSAREELSVFSLSPPARSHRMLQFCLSLHFLPRAPCNS